MKDTCPHLAKLDPKGLKVVFIGYESGSKAYRLYYPVGGASSRVSRRVFDESTFWQLNDEIEADHNLNQFTVEYLVIEPKEGGAQHQEPSLPSAGAPLNQWNSQHHGLRIRRWMPSRCLIWRPRYWRMDDLVGGGEPPRLAARELEEVAELHAISQMNQTP